MPTVNYIIVFVLVRVTHTGLIYRRSSRRIVFPGRRLQALYSSFVLDA